MTVVRRLSREWPMVAVLTAFAAGVVMIGLHYWRRGLFVTGLALLFGGFLRLVLPTRLAGFLAIRGRTTDVVTMALFGACVVLLSAIIPISEG
ncbi:MAG: DUF3017 domain-containing protein [Mycobacteriales bacterium]